MGKCNRTVSWRPFNASAVRTIVVWTCTNNAVIFVAVGRPDRGGSVIYPRERSRLRCSVGLLLVRGDGQSASSSPAALDRLTCICRRSYRRSRVGLHGPRTAALALSPIERRPLEAAERCRSVCCAPSGAVESGHAPVNDLEARPEMLRFFYVVEWYGARACGDVHVRELNSGSLASFRQQCAVALQQ